MCQMTKYTERGINVDLMCHIECAPRGAPLSPPRETLRFLRRIKAFRRFLALTTKEYHINGFVWELRCDLVDSLPWCQREIEASCIGDAFGVGSLLFGYLPSAWNGHV